MYRMAAAEMVIAIAVMMVALPLLGPIIVRPAKADDYSKSQCVFCGVVSLHLGFGFDGHHD
jgi:hypothetical protein